MFIQALLVLFVPLWIARFFKLKLKIGFRRPSLFVLLLTCFYILWNFYHVISAFGSDIFFLTNTSTESPSFILKRNYRLHIEKTGYDPLGFDLLLEKLPEQHSKISEYLELLGIKTLTNCFACSSYPHYLIFHLYYTVLDYFCFFVVAGILTFGCKNNVRWFALLPSVCFLVLEALWITLGDKSIDLLYSFFEHDKISHFTLNQTLRSTLFVITALVLLFIKFGEAHTDSKIKTVTELSKAIVSQLRQLNRIQIVYPDSKDSADNSSGQ